MKGGGEVNHRQSSASVLPLVLELLVLVSAIFDSNLSIALPFSNLSSVTCLVLITASVSCFLAHNSTVLSQHGYFDSFDLVQLCKVSRS